jgi:non-specific serine/threonine protein kinase
MVESGTNWIYRFGVFELNTSERRLLQAGKPTALGPRAFDLLVALVARSGHLVSKEDLLDSVWPNVVVEEANLQVQISALRKVLGTAAIATVAGHGYQFTAECSREALHDSPEQSSPRHNLAVPLSSFIGREHDVAKVRQLLRERRAVTLVGPGGIGKTRLALRVAWDLVEEYPDGVWFVDLAPIVDPEVVPATMASVLRVDIGIEAAPVESLVRRLKSLQLLVLLDNCEQVIEASARMIHALLTGSTKLSVLATSREPLAIAGEQVFRLPSLALPEEHALLAEEVQAAPSVQLFIERATAADAHFAIDEQSVHSIAAICRRLDGIPLAIEMAAARTPALGIPALEQQLDGRFRLLTGGVRTAVPRHKTLRATLDWSYELLGEEECAVLRALAIFRGGFTLEAASVVVSDGGTDQLKVVDLLSRLVACSLVVVDATQTGTRYRLLDTTRAYAIEKLGDAAEIHALARRHAQYFRERFACADDDWWHMRNADWDSVYLPERDNVSAALDWAFAPAGDAEIGIALAGASGQLWASPPNRNEGRRWFERAAARIGEDTPLTSQAQVWYWLGRLLRTVLPLRAVAAMETAVGTYRQLHTFRDLGLSLVHLARYSAEVDRFEQTASMLAEGSTLLQAAGHPKALAVYFHVSGWIKMLSRDLSGARMQVEHALSLYRVEDEMSGVLACLGALADITWAMGDLAPALSSLTEAVTCARHSQPNDKMQLAYLLVNLGGVLTEYGALDDALTAFREAIPMLKQVGESWLGFVDHLALRAGLSGKVSVAAYIAGHGEATSALVQRRRGPNEARAHKQLHTMLQQKIAPDELERLLAEGAAMGEDDVCRVALED